MPRLSIAVMLAAATVAATTLCSAGAQRIEPPPDLVNQSPAQLQDSIERKHPITYLLLAKSLFAAGRRDEAVFWFYLGQLRYRAYLASRPDLDPTGDPALFASLFHVLGPKINEYAFGDIPALARIIERTLAWDAEHGDEYAPRGPRRDEVRRGLERLKSDIVARADELRAQRTANGLENRTR